MTNWYIDNNEQDNVGFSQKIIALICVPNCSAKGCIYNDVSLIIFLSLLN
ncbi:MAG: hypothetical protein F6K22_09690 [Okeania sp. SIO2F4]|nr:hypothetical protein [Okeania sp. SIO2F4]NES03099.1 hypothetical protein [Okeania sp. SIO2F4]